MVNLFLKEEIQQLNHYGGVESLWWKIIDIFDVKSKIKFDDMCNKLFSENF